MALNSTRPSNGFGVSAIPYTELKAFFELNEIEPEGWQIKLLKNLDIISLRYLNGGT